MSSDWFLRGHDNGSYAGRFPGTLAMGDFDGDGLTDLAVGIQNDRTMDPDPEQGSVCVIGAMWGGTEACSYVGSAVASGDVTGDGRIDLLFGGEGADCPGAVNLVPGL